MRFPIPLSIVVFLLLTAAGAYWVRKVTLERAMLCAMEVRDVATMKSLAQCWPAPVNVEQGDEDFYVTEQGERLNDRVTPLHIAAQEADAELARVLIRRGAKVDANPSGDEPIHEAAKAGAVEVTRLLLRSGASANARSKSGFRPLHLVSRRWYRRPLDTEAFAFRVPQKPPEKCVLTAQILLDAGAEVDARSEEERKTPLHIAAEAGDLRLVKLLLARGAKVNALDIYRQTPLVYTLYKPPDDNVPILLLRSGADPRVKNCDNETAVDMAAALEKFSVIRAMVECGLDPNTTVGSGFTLLHWALNHYDEAFLSYLPSDRGCPDLLHLLIEKGANVNAPDPDGDTPLSQAVTAEVVRMLVAAGADVNASGTDGWTPLHGMTSRAEPLWDDFDQSGEGERAMFERWVGAIEALLAAGADVNASTSDGETPISIVNDRLREAKDDGDAAGFRRVREALLKAGAVE